MELEVFNVTPREIAGGDVVWDVYVWITDLEPSRTTAFMSDFDLYVEKADGNGTDPNLNARDYKTPENRTLEMEFLYKWRIERWEVYRCDFWVISSLTTEYEGGLCRLMFDYYSWWCVGQVDLPDSFEDFEDD